MSENQTLHQKLLEVQKAVDYVQAQDHGKTTLKYKYASISQLLGAIRPIMDSVGLLLEASVVDTAFHPGVIPYKSGAQHLTEVTMEFTWVNVDAPDERLAFRGYGQGVDSGEKGSGKAATYAEKTALLKFFHVPVDDEDPDAFQGQNGNSRQRPQVSVRPSQTRARPEMLGNEGRDRFQEYCGDTLPPAFAEELSAFLQKRWRGVSKVADVPAADEAELLRWADAMMAEVPEEQPESDAIRRLREAGKHLNLTDDAVERKIASYAGDEDKLSSILAEWRAVLNEKAFPPDMDGDVDEYQMTHSEPQQLDLQK